jgi:hypothetical protein
VWLVAAFCRNQPRLSVSILGTSRLRCGGLRSPLTRQTYPLKQFKKPELNV